MQNNLFDFGMVGLGVMGSNLLLNMADHGFSVIGYDKDPQKTHLLKSSSTPGTLVEGVNSLEQMVSRLKSPRRIMMLVPAGNPVDQVVGELKPLLAEGDIIIDGGNSHYTDTLRRLRELSVEGFHFMGIGISGGEEGARRGPSIMPGGNERAYEAIAPILEAIAAKVQDVPCVAYLGKDAAGHYVKMVHNGIEYAVMQLISECYDIMKNGLQLSNAEMHQVFAQWNAGAMQSYLLEITAAIFAQADDRAGGDLIDVIGDRAGAKGTGKWTSLEGLDLPLPVPTIDAAVMMRNISSLQEERILADELYRTSIQSIDIDKEEFLPLLHDALHFATIISYAQGLAMLSAASRQLQMDIPLDKVVDVWRGGCIIRSALLGTLKKAIAGHGATNVLLDRQIAEMLQQQLPAMQKIVSLAGGNNFAMTGLMASLNYFNAYRRRHLPTNLIQAQRDFFGAHTYERTDVPGFFHTVWQADSPNNPIT